MNDKRKTRNDSLQRNHKKNNQSKSCLREKPKEGHSLTHSLTGWLPLTAIHSKNVFAVKLDIGLNLSLFVSYLYLYKLSPKTIYNVLL